MHHSKIFNRFEGLFLVLLIMSLVACEQVIDLDLKTAPPRLVVEGRIEKPLSGEPIAQQMIRLTTVSEFFQNTEPPAVVGAEVWVTDPMGTRFDFQEHQPGVYLNTDLGNPDASQYTLHIIWQGETYEASEQLVLVPAIDSLYQLEAEATLFEDGGLKLAIDFTDPETTANYYLWETFVDGILNVIPNPGNKDNIIAKDDFFNGQQVEGYFPNEELVMEPGEEGLVRQFGLSENAYRYYFAVFDQAGKTGSILDTPPALVRGNIINLDDPENFALGYFYVTEVAEADLVVTESN